MTGAVLVAFPGPLAKSIVWNRDDVVVFDESGWWIRESGNRRCVAVADYSPQWATGGDVQARLSAVMYWSPLWSRWVAHADEYEILLREAVYYVACLATAIRQLGVCSAIFHTGVPHHLDSALLQTASAEANVPQVFLYDNVVSGRLLPLMQRRSIEDRAPLGAIISDHDATADIERFRINSAAGCRPQMNTKTAPVNGLYRSAWFGGVDAFTLVVRQRVGQAIRYALGKWRPGFFDQFRPFGVTEFIRLIVRQRRALAYHDSRIRRGPLSSLCGEGTRPALLLAAHYQPEATSFPEGGHLHNHFDILVRLRALGYEGPVIYKEHIASYLYYSPFIHQTRVGINRSETYYRRLEDLGCVFADPAEVVDLGVETNHRIIPITITGTMAIERSLAGLTTLVAGHPWYAGMPGTISLDTMTSIDGAIIEPSRWTGVAEQASRFLSETLSHTTLVNAPGIGSGRPLRDSESVAQFTAEFERLIAVVRARNSPHE